MTFQQKQEYLIAAVAANANCKMPMTCWGKQENGGSRL